MSMPFNYQGGGRPLCRGGNSARQSRRQFSPYNGSNCSSVGGVMQPEALGVQAAYERAQLVKVLSIAAFLGLMLFVLGVSERGPIQLPAVGLFIALTAAFLLIAPLLMWRWAARHLHTHTLIALARGGLGREATTQTSPHGRRHPGGRQSGEQHIIIALPRRRDRFGPLNNTQLAHLGSLPPAGCVSGAHNPAPPLPTYEQALLMKDGQVAAPPLCVPPPDYAHCVQQRSGVAHAVASAAGCSAPPQSHASAGGVQVGHGDVVRDHSDSSTPTTDGDAAAAGSSQTAPPAESPAVGPQSSRRDSSPPSYESSRRLFFWTFFSMLIISWL